MVTPETAAVLAALVPPGERPALDAAILRHQTTVEAARTPAERGEAIELPLLACRVGGEAFTAEAGAILERADWSLLNASPEVPPEALRLSEEGAAMEVDIAGGRLTFSEGAAPQPRLPLQRLRTPPGRKRS